MFNHAASLKHIDANSASFPSHSKRRPPPDPCLPLGLPSTAVIRREASLIAPKSLEAQIIQDASHPIEALKEAISTSITDLPTQAPSPLSDINPATPTSPIRRLLSMTKAKGAKIPWKDPEPWEVLRAVENKDVIYLMEVRDRAFHALVCPSGGLTPLIHAMHIGKSHHDVAITLVGAFSRYINSLEGKDFAKKEIKSILVSIRGSLKVAIDYGLQSSQIDLLASFMQTLVMSEGDHWIQEQLKLVATALRQGPSACPVEVARTSIKRIATHALNKAPLIAELEDYISNATLDLLMMAAWSLALESFHGEPIPPYSFARDDRVYRAFTERLDKYRDHINRRLRKQLKSQLETLRTIIQGRARSWHGKVDLLKSEFDEA